MLAFFYKQTNIYRRALTLGVICGITLLMLALYVVNIRSFKSYHQDQALRGQQRLEDYGRCLSLLLNERKKDITLLANDAALKRYFQLSKELVAETELQRSAQAVLEIFKRIDHREETAGGTYNSLSLLSTGGEELVALHQPGDQSARTLSQVPFVRTSTQPRHTQEDESTLTLTQPVLLDGELAGFIQGKLHYDTLVDQLMPAAQGLLLLTNQRNVVYRSLPECTVSSGLLQSLIHGNASPIEVRESLGSFDLTHPCVPKYSQVFYVPVPGYSLLLYQVATDGVAQNLHYRQVFSYSFFGVFLGALVLAGVSCRFATKKQWLLSNLSQAQSESKTALEQKQTLELVLQGAQLGTWNWNIATGEIELNDRFFTMLGYEPGELPLHLDTWKRLLHPEDSTFVLPVLDAHLRGTTPFYSTEHRLRHKDGHWVWVLDIGQVLVRDEDGKPLRAFGIHVDISERKEVTRILSRAKRESDAIIRKFLDTLIVVDTACRVVRVNQATCAMLGYEENELLYRPVVELFHNTPERVLEAFSFEPVHGEVSAAPDFLSSESWADQNECEARRNIELCYRHKDGSRLPMSLNIFLLRNQQGQVTGSVAGGKDVSELRQAIETIDVQKQYIEALFDTVSVGVVALSPQGDLVRSNQAFGAIVEKWSNRLGLETQATTARLVDGILLEGKDENAREGFIYVLEQGETRGYFRCSVAAMSPREGIATVLSVDDITSEQVAEEAKRFLAMLIEQTSEAVLVTGTDGIIDYVNPACCTMTGYSAGEMIGRNPTHFTDGLVALSVLDEMRTKLKSGESWSGHLRSRRKDGSILEEETTISPIRNNHGETTHFVSIWHDITELVELQQQLSKAQKLESIGQLAAGIAHEINTPMQYVQNNVTFIEQSFEELQNLLTYFQRSRIDALPPDIKPLVNELDLEFLLDEVPTSIRETLQGINRVVKIVSAMKEFSHPGNQDKVPTDVNHTLESTLIVCRNEWKYSAELITDLAEDLPAIPCYVDQLHQALVNLIVNATHAIEEKKKHDPGATGCISISTAPYAEGVEIRIKDNGPGIPDIIRARIFEPFFTTKEVGKGTGQGLAIVREVVVEKHGGTVDFESSTEQGTTFILRLPAQPSNTLIEQ